MTAIPFQSCCEDDTNERALECVMKTYHANFS